MIFSKHNRLVYRYDAEELWIEAWAENAFRVRATKMQEMPQHDWALLQPSPIEPKLRWRRRKDPLQTATLRPPFLSAARS